jgi:hypothetical protein
MNQKSSLRETARNVSRVLTGDKSNHRFTAICGLQRMLCVTSPYRRAMWDAAYTRRRHNAVLGQMPAQCVDRLCALAHQQVSGTVGHRHGLLFLALHGDEPHRWPCRRLGDRLGVGHVVLLPLHERFHVNRRDQFHRMSERRNRPRPMVRTGAGLHRHRAAGQVSEELQHLQPDNFRRNTTDPSAAAPCAWNTFFPKSNPMMLISAMDASLLAVLRHPLPWHVDAVGRASTPSLDTILHIPGHQVFVIDRKPWWEMPDLARHISNQKCHPLPPFETD